MTFGAVVRVAAILLNPWAALQVKRIKIKKIVRDVDVCIYDTYIYAKLDNNCRKLTLISNWYGKSKECKPRIVAT